MTNEIVQWKQKSETIPDTLFLVFVSYTWSFVSSSSFPLTSHYKLKEKQEKWKLKILNESTSTWLDNS